MDAEVLVVGAGLAGLRCAAELHGAGVDVRVLERADAVGGRVRTDVVDGYRCDRGFQLLNPAYPAVRRYVDLPALALRSFGAGAIVRREDGPVVVADPRREPRLLARTLRSGLLAPRELVALARWLGPTLARPHAHAGSGPGAGPDETLAASLTAAGITGPLRRELLDPFLAGVLADHGGGTSAAFARLLLRSFALGTPGVPAAGMQALPDQLAAPLGARIATGVDVDDVREEAGGVRVRAGEGTWRAEAVVVAVPGEGVSALTPLPPVATKALTTWWFDCDGPPSPLPLLVLDGRGRGPVQNALDLTAAAPSYAPAGRRLVQATTLTPAATTGEAEVRAHLADLYGTATDTWRLVVRHDVPHALPAQPPPLDARRPVALTDRLFVAGDHRDTGSIQGALVSGTRAARAVLRRLTGTPTGR
ncbi:NAD(P)/FAD-dependent oxidoreductase [Nocardioides sp. YIM 152588]|uniref:NAD(P)/FAD-dependent oxidoreductase n=1 Tax=Nocardioides sp. YIM 152588 TaxID=3158259 RepID=UPI0032E4065F